MNIMLVTVLTWLALGLEMGLKSTLGVRLGSVVAAPSFVLPLAVFIALCAPAMQASWACLVLGLFMDLTSPVALPGDSLVVIGPHAIGYFLACQFVLAIRGVVIRRHPLAVVVLSIVAAGIMQIAVTASLTLRAVLIDQAMIWSAKHEIVERLASAVVTGGTAFVVAIILAPMAPLLGLPAARSWVKRA
jgi:hypothetical protein